MANNLDAYEKWQRDGVSESNAIKIRSLAMLGETLDVIAGALGVSVRTLIRIRSKHKLISDAMRVGREVIVYEAQSALREMVKGKNIKAVIYTLRVYGPEIYRKDRVVPPAGAEPPAPAAGLDLSKISDEDLRALEEIHRRNSLP